MSIQELREIFEKEMTKQGRSIKRVGNAYEDYGVVLCWWGVQWGYEHGIKQ